MIQAWMPDEDNTLLSLSLSRDLKRAYAAAYNCALLNHHETIGTRHLLRGLVSSAPNSAAQILSACNMTDDYLSQQLPLHPGNSTFDGVSTLSSTAWSAIQDAQQEARQALRAEIIVVDLLIGLINQDRDIAKVMFEKMGDVHNLQIECLRE